MSGRYCVLRVSDTTLRSVRKSQSHFFGILLVHRGEELRNYWLRREEIRKLKKLRRRGNGLVTGILIVEENLDLALYPAWFGSKLASDMKMEDEDGFVCSQPFSALKLLLPPGHARRGPV